MSSWHLSTNLTKWARLVKPLVATLLPKMIERVNTRFEEVSAKRGKRPTAFKFLQEVKPEAIAYITIKTVLGALTSAEQTTVQAAASAVGRGFPASG
ncbi:RNA polymerase [Aeromonas phage avDM11-UST]|nr:RNA polymerase [Aeromonas phage avDM11-UST]